MRSITEAPIGEEFARQARVALHTAHECARYPKSAWARDTLDRATVTLTRLGVIADVATRIPGGITSSGGPPPHMPMTQADFDRLGISRAYDHVSAAWTVYQRAIEKALSEPVKSESVASGVTYRPHPESVLSVIRARAMFDDVLIEHLSAVCESATEVRADEGFEPLLAEPATKGHTVRAVQVSRGPISLVAVNGKRCAPSTQEVFSQQASRNRTPRA